MIRLLAKGTVAGLLLSLLIAGIDAYMAAKFGLITLIAGVGVGGLLMVAGLGCSLTAYWLARRGRAGVWGGRLIQAAIGLAVAGMSCGFAAALLWALAGRPTMG